MNETNENDQVLYPKPQPESPNLIPRYHKCLDCQDYGITCNGPNLVALGNIGAVRSFHRAMKKARNISLKAIADAARTISDSTINEYFSSIEKDYKWTTVVAIDNAITSICGKRVGLPPLDQTCPSTSSEYRQQLATAELKLAAAELRQAQTDAECESLRRKISDGDGANAAKIQAIRSVAESEVNWLKGDVQLWRRFAIILLVFGIVIFAFLSLYIAMDLSHPAHGFIRY